MPYGMNSPMRFLCAIISLEELSIYLKSGAAIIINGHIR